MSENESALNGGASATTENSMSEASTEASTETSTEASTETSTEEISYHAVEKDGVVTAIWEMQGRKHIRTIDPRSRQGQDILRLYTTEHHDEATQSETAVASS
jgi:hypothetical protein